jgi:hypothetical protein
MTTYSFFGHLNVVINSRGHRGYNRYFENEYQRIAERATSAGVPTVTVEIVDRLPEPQSGDLSERVHYKRMFHFEHLVRGIDTDNVTVFFKKHWVDKLYMNAIGVFVQCQVLEPIMYLKLLERNVLLMHAAGVADDEAGYLFPAYGGTGKTTTSMALLGEGFRLLGDDLLIVDLEARTVHPYARPLHLFTYNVRHLHGASVPLKYRTAIYTKNVLRFVLERLLRTEFLISTRVHADELFPNDPFGQRVPYRKLCFLTKEGPATSEVELTEQKIPEVATEVMRSADLNDSLYRILGEDESIASVQKLETKVISELLSHFDSITYVNSRQLDLDDLGPFVREHLRRSTA